MKEKELAPNFKIPSSNNKEFELKKNKNKFLTVKSLEFLRIVLKVTKNLLVNSKFHFSYCLMKKL
jgi:hypothetical protein